MKSLIIATSLILVSNLAFAEVRCSYFRGVKTCSGSGESTSHNLPKDASKTMVSIYGASAQVLFDSLDLDVVSTGVDGESTDTKKTDGLECTRMVRAEKSHYQCNMILSDQGELLNP